VADHGESNDMTRTHVILTKDTMVSHYRIVEKIGAGGMGEVFLAQDTTLNRRIALKFMPAHIASDKDLRVRFTREAQAAAQLDHPNIVSVYEVGEYRGLPYIAMAHIEGESLRDIIKNGTLSTSESVNLALQICEGLKTAHEAGIVHRDVKPANVIIDRSGRVRILDFGLATIAGEDKLTKTGTTLGTVGYMAPEQILGKRVGRQADLFSVGVILYEMLTGRRPFDGHNDAAVLRAITDSTPEPIARFKSGVTGELQQVVNKALAKDPATRYQHADDMVTDLKRLGLETAKPRKKRRIALAVAAAGLVLSVAGYFLSDYLMKSQPQTEVTPPVLVVLPFENLGTLEGDFFSVGIADEITTRLALIDQVRVISRGSAFRYAGSEKDIQQIGTELGADYVIEGTIRWDRSGEIDRIRITPKLIKTLDGYLMWAENYEEELSQIFDVQVEIAEKVVTSLGLTLLEPESGAPDYAPTDNMAAYNYYLRGLDISSKGMLKSHFLSAIAMFDSAIALDPNFALAWAHKSFIHSEFNFIFATLDAAFHQSEAKRAAEQSLAIDPDLSMGHISMGTYYNMVGTDYESAMASFSAARSEVTSSAALSEGIGIVLMRQGKWQEALARLEEAVQIDPLNSRRYFYLSNCYAMIREYESAGRALDRALILDPTSPDVASLRLYVNLLQHGQLEGEDIALARMLSEAIQARVATYEVVSSTALGLWRFMEDRINIRESIAAVHEISEERSPHIVYLNIGQLYDLAGDHDSALIFYDSARLTLEKVIADGNPEFHAYSEIGITYALLGRSEEAILAGITGKEMMSVTDCHW